MTGGTYTSIAGVVGAVRGGRVHARGAVVASLTVARWCCHVLKTAILSCVTWCALRYIIQAHRVTVGTPWAGLPVPPCAGRTEIAGGTDGFLTDGTIAVVPCWTLVALNCLRMVDLCVVSAGHWE